MPNRSLLISTEETSSGGESGTESLQENRQRDLRTAAAKLPQPDVKRMPGFTSLARDDQAKSGTKKLWTGN